MEAAISLTGSDAFTGNRSHVRAQVRAVGQSLPIIGLLANKLWPNGQGASHFINTDD